MQPWGLSLPPEWGEAVWGTGYYYALLCAPCQTFDSLKPLYRRRYNYLLSHFPDKLRLSLVSNSGVIASWGQEGALQCRGERRDRC